MPPPFDNTYNSPEHDAFVLKVKYQRNDSFFTDNLVDGADRARLNQAWNDLFGSWPYHDAYLGMLADHYGLTLKSRTIQDMDAAAIAALPADVRPHVTSLRAHYDEVTRAQTLAEPGHVTDALDVRQPRLAPAADAAEKTEPARVLPAVASGESARSRRGDPRRCVARILVSPAFLYRVETVARGPERPLTGWEMASRMSFFLWSSIPGRRAAACRGRRRAEQSGDAGEAGQAHDGRSEGPPLRDRVLRPVARVLPLRRVPRRRHRPVSRNSPTK